MSGEKKVYHFWRMRLIYNWANLWSISIEDLWDACDTARGVQWPKETCKRWAGWKSLYDMVFQTLDDASEDHVSTFSHPSQCNDKTESRGREHRVPIYGCYLEHSKMGLSKNQSSRTIPKWTQEHHIALTASCSACWINWLEGDREKDTQWSCCGYAALDSSKKYFCVSAENLNHVRVHQGLAAVLSVVSTHERVLCEKHDCSRCGETGDRLLL